MGSFYEGSALRFGKGSAMADYVYGLHIIPSGGRIQAILCAALFARGADIAVCTDQELIYVLQASVFARCQVIPFLSIEALEFSGRSIYITYRESRPPDARGAQEPSAQHREVLAEEHISIPCFKEDMQQLYRHILQRWRASGAIGAMGKG